MNCDVIIVGQGLAGTILGHKLEKKNKKVIFFDPGHNYSSSKVAAGIINPVTGRNYVKSWMIDELLPLALETYKSIEQRFSFKICNQLPIIRGLNFAAQENLWYSKIEDPEYSNYISSVSSKFFIEQYIHPAYSYGRIHNAYQIDIPKLIKTYRTYLNHNRLLIDKKLDYSKLKVEKNRVCIGDLTASKIVFAEGWQGVDNPFFNTEPFNLVKGEMLFVKIPDGPEFNLRHNIFITPVGNDIYWCGSNYDRNYINIEPTQERRIRLEAFLKDILNVPYEILDHKSGIRPATIDRKPIVKQHSTYSQMYIFNGMGAKGSSMIPYFADQLCSFL